MNILVISANKEDNLGDILIYDALKSYLECKGGRVQGMNFRLQYYDLDSRESDDDTTSELKGFKSLLFRVKDSIKKLKLLYLFLQVFYFLLKAPSYFSQFKEKYKNNDVIIIGGGQILMDTDASLLFSFNLFFHILMGKAFNKKILFLGVGITNKFNFRVTEMVIKFAFNSADAIMVRDVFSYHRALKLLPDSNKISFSIDLAVLYNKFDSNTYEQKASEPLIGISTLPYYDVRYYPQHDIEVFERYKDSIRKVSEYFLKNRAINVALVPTTSVDLVVASEINQKLIIQSDSVDELISSISSCSSFIGTRMHSFIISIILNKPALCFAWDSKINGFISSFNGFDMDVFLFDFDDMQDTKVLVNKIDSINHSPVSYKLDYHSNRLKSWIGSNVFTS